MIEEDDTLSVQERIEEIRIELEDADAAILLALKDEGDLSASVTAALYDTHADELETPKQDATAAEPQTANANAHPAIDIGTPKIG